MTETGQRRAGAPRGASLFWWTVVVLAILHYDFWFWDDATILFGFLPIGLFYHILYSLAAALVWALAVRYVWPTHIEEWATAGEDGGATGPPGPEKATAR